MLAPMDQAPSAAGRRLIFRLIIRGIFGQLLLGAALFLPARTFSYWQAWAYLIVNDAMATYACVYLWKHDRTLLERRMLRREPAFAQKAVIVLWRLLAAALLVASAQDHRLGWTRAAVGDVPVWLVLVALALMVLGHLIYLEVLKANSYAASVIRVETGQSVISTGPYARVRHPMYAGFLFIWIFTPLALGSLVTLPWALLIIPIIVLRLLHEEKMLRRELPGYAEYCARMPYRLIPRVW